MMNTFRNTAIAIMITSTLAFSHASALSQENTSNVVDDYYTATSNVSSPLYSQVQRVIHDPKAQHIASAYAAVFSLLAIIGIIARNVPGKQNVDKNVDTRDYEHTFVTEVYQGDKITIRGKSCTVGYIDHKNRVAYTAGHCGFTDETVEVFDTSNNPIGTIYTRYSRERTPFVSADQAVIKLYDDVYPGENIFSGNIKIDYTDIRPGDRVCSFSRTTQQTMCGEVLYTARNSIGATRNAAGDRGDSGGPAWIEGKGFVGLYVGYAHNEGQDTLFSMIS